MITEYQVPSLQQRQIHSLVLLFHLGMASRFKYWANESQRINMLNLQNLENPSHELHGARPERFRKQMEEYSRKVEECKMTISEEWKQQAIFDFVDFMARMLLKLSEENGVWPYVPELYIETVLDMFNVRNKLYDDKIQLQRFGSIENLITFQVQHIRRRGKQGQGCLCTYIHSVSLELGGGFVCAFLSLSLSFLAGEALIRPTNNQP